MNAWLPDTETEPTPAPESEPVGSADSPGPESEGNGGDGFDDTPPTTANDDELVLDLDGFEGPIDALLSLARDQKVDLRKISILELADQYLAFIARARRLRLELAADYLVMAAWLAYLKSRLLLPEPPADGEPSGAELAAALAFQLQRLEAMQEAGKRLMALPQFGIDFFARGAPEPARIIDVPVWDVTLFDLLKAYGTHPGRRKEGMLRIAPLNLFSMDDALKRIGDMLGHVLDWTVLRNFLPEGMDTPIQRRAAMAATFAATLELARNGRIELRQEGTFAPIYLRRSNRRDDIEPAPAPDLQQG
ncbi:segregation and condensation protein A [Dongia sedimenti]|uniref:Segregation and condensation protein A n=1 Tax=Dongia sedimenti TaxID=3064282 RepID=A0ABU0YJ12_9PROT|nr:ScpA family protein [Rhodospirillaceae bacterium R-7]